MNNITSAIIITDISDHLPIVSYFSSKIEEQPDNLTFKCRPMKDIQINKIVQSLEMEDWHSLLTTDANINTAYDNFIAKLWDIINTHAPQLQQAFREFLVSPALIRNYKAVIFISFIWLQYLNQNCMKKLFRCLSSVCAARPYIW